VHGDAERLSQWCQLSRNAIGKRVNTVARHGYTTGKPAIAINSDQAKLCTRIRRARTARGTCLAWEQRVNEN
jgi:hypothetical protein